MNKKSVFRVIVALWICLWLAACKIYSFKDVSIPDQVKTIHIAYLDNKSRYVNPTFSPQLTNSLKMKINNQTRLTQVENGDADYDITGYVSGYDVTTSGVSNQQAATNRLTVSVTISLKNRLIDRKIGTPNFDDQTVTRSFDYSASLTLSDAEPQLLPSIISNMTDEIFNKIFSNW